MKLGNSQAIYVIYNPDFNITKIGISDNVEKRRVSLQGACGCELLLHYNTKHVFNAKIHEEEAHKKLADKRRVGEWFNITPEEATNVVKSVISEAVGDPIIENYINGSSISQIAKDNNVSRQAIISKLKYYGYYSTTEIMVSRPHKGDKCRITPMIMPDNPKILPKPNKKITDPNTFLDEEKPTLPIGRLKRMEPNINFNGKWYQISTYRNGEFFYAYTKDIEKAREYVKEIK